MPNTTPPRAPTLLPQQFYIGLTAITVICVQFLNLLMSVEPSYSGTKVHWNDKETEALLDYLIENKTLGHGNGNFRDPLYTSAAEAISGHLSSGAPKNSKNCKIKWTAVILFVISPYLSLIIDQQLKGIYTAIEDFRNNVSGAHWDADTGATIEGPMAEKVWKDIVTAKVRITLFLLFLSDMIYPTIGGYETLQKSWLAVLR